MRYLVKGMHLLMVWLVSAIALVVAAYVLPSVQIADFKTALVAALVIGLLDATLAEYKRLCVRQVLHEPDAPAP